MVPQYENHFNYISKRFSLRFLINKVYNRIKHRYINVPSIFLNKNPYYKNCLIGDYTYGSPDGSPLLIYGDPTAKLEIGKFCSFGGRVIIFLGSSNHRPEWISTYPFTAFFEEANRPNIFDSKKLNVTIGNDVWVGTGATILSGLSIGDGCIIGTQSVVTKDIEPYSIVAGNPARLIRKRFDEITINKLQAIKWWNWGIEDILKNIDHILKAPDHEFLDQFL